MEVKVFKIGKRWRWKAIWGDGSIELSPESYVSSKTAKAIAKMCYPDSMVVVLKCNCEGKD